MNYFGFTMKKFIFTSALLAASFLQTAHAKTTFKSGAAIGMSIGYSHLSAKTKENVLITPNPHIVFGYGGNSSFKKTHTSNGFVADVFAGYRFKLTSNFLVGFDISFSKETNTLKQNNLIPLFDQESTTELHRQFSIIPALTAGYTFADKWMLYAKLGLSISRFSLENKNLGAVAISTPEKTFTKLGVKETLGIEYAVTEKAALFSEVSFEQIQSKKVRLTNPTVTPAFTHQSHDVKVKPRYITAKIGVLYKI